MGADLCVLLHMYMCVLRSVQVCPWVCMDVPMGASLCMCVLVRVHGCACVGVSLCALVCMHACRRVCARVHMQWWGTEVMHKVL